MLVIGITGGVGCGKSRVMEYLQEHCNCRIVLADDVGNKVKEPGQKCYEKIVALLGEEVLNEDKTINKFRMAEMIFADTAVLEQVNRIIHPAVEEYILNEIETEKRKQKIDVFFLEAALLIEAGYLQYLDELWYIYSNEEVRKERLKASRQYSDEKIRKIMAGQLSEEEFRKYADAVLDNSFDFEVTKNAIQKECLRLGIWKEGYCSFNT